MHVAAAELKEQLRHGTLAVYSATNDQRAMLPARPTERSDRPQQREPIPLMTP